jgi:hypothetical protein
MPHGCDAGSCNCHHFSETAKKDISKLARSIILVGSIISVATKQNRTEFIMAPVQSYPYFIYTGESDELDELPGPLRIVKVHTSITKLLGQAFRN